jgi:hypothetical protein
MDQTSSIIMKNNKEKKDDFHFSPIDELQLIIKKENKEDI